MTDCDFIPGHYHEKYNLSRAIQLRISCVGAMALLMIIWVLAHKNDVATAEAMLTEIVYQKRQLEDHAAKKAEMEEEKARLSRYQNLIDHLSDKGSLVVIFSSLSQHIPESLILTRVTLQCPSVYIFAKNPNGRAENKTGAEKNEGNAGPSLRTEDRSPVIPFLIMEGMAVTDQDVIQFAADLERSRLFRNVKVHSRGMMYWSGHQGKGFEMVCELAPQEKKSQ